LQFVDDTGVDDLVTSAVQGNPPRREDVRPGGRLSWNLSPGAFRSREPPDPLSRNPATTVLTTLPLTIVISQGSEPHIFRIDGRLALAAAIGGTTGCALVSSQVRALTYFGGVSPGVP
jgi:hypothetical protein